MFNKSLGKNSKIEVNERGGKHGKLDYSFHLMDGPALLSLANVLNYGVEKYPRDNWRLISEEDHINHALTHIFAYMSENKQDDHLEHAFCRLMMALALKIRPNYLGYAKKK
jgi:hypothetical protein